MAEILCHKIEGGIWGCLVVMATFCIQFVVMGTSKSIGVYNVEFLEYFDAGAASVSLVGSINLGMILGTGPLASLLMTRWSCRQVALVGAVFANIGIITMPFAPNLPFMYVFYGVIAGLGQCLLFIPSSVLSGLYFYKQRSFVTGFASAGSGLGGSVFPIIFHYMIEYYGWKGSFFIVAGVNLHLFVFAALLRPAPKDLLEFLMAQEIADKQEKYQDSFRSENIADCSPSVFKTSALSPSSNRTVYTIDMGGGCPVLNDINVQRKNKPLKDKIKHHCVSIFTFDFVFFCISSIFWTAGISILFIFLPEYIVRMGISKKDSSVAFLAVGVGTCIGSVVVGVLGNVKRFDRIVLYIGANLGMGLVTLLMVSPLVYSFAGMFTLSLLVGITVGIDIGLMVVITSDLLGTETLGYGFGYHILCHGVGIFVGPPLAGILIDVTGRVQPGIIFSAVLSVIGGIVMTVIPVKRHIQRHKNKSENQ